MKTFLDYYDSPLWRYYSNSFSTYYKMEEVDNNIEVEIKMPGVKKEDLTVKYISDKSYLKIVLRDGGEREVYLQRQIDPEGIVATLELGILKITAPIKNTDRIIQIT